MVSYCQVVPVIFLKYLAKSSRKSGLVAQSPVTAPMGHDQCFEVNRCRMHPSRLLGKIRYVGHDLAGVTYEYTVICNILLGSNSTPLHTSIHTWILFRFTYTKIVLYIADSSRTFLRLWYLSCFLLYSCTDRELLEENIGHCKNQNIDGNLQW